MFSAHYLYLDFFGKEIHKYDPAHEQCSTQHPHAHAEGPARKMAKKAIRGAN